MPKEDKGGRFWVGAVSGLIGFGLGYLAFSRGVLDKGYAARRGLSYDDFPPRELEVGTDVEMEHTYYRPVARRIAADHLAEDPNYYSHYRRHPSMRYDVE